MSKASRLLLLAFALPALLPPAALRAAPKVPKELAQARYVVLGFDVGDAFIAESAPDDPRVLPEDRERLAALRAELERWGRYKVVVRPEQAELVVAIRVGRQATMGGGGYVGGTPPSRPGFPPGIGSPPGAEGGFGRAELSSSQDVLAVYGSLSLGTPLWRGQSSGGLKGSPPPLFARFRSDVEKAAKAP
jgi:hypothetical protein